MSDDRPIPLGGANVGVNLELALHFSAEACQVSKKSRNFVRSFTGRIANDSVC